MKFTIVSPTQLEEEDEVVLEEEEDMFSDVGTPEPEEGPPTALEHLSCHLSELLDSEPLTQPIGGDCLSPSHSTSLLKKILFKFCIYLGQQYLDQMSSW